MVVFIRHMFKYHSGLILHPHAEPGPAIEGVFGKDWCMDLWREEKLPPQRKVPMEAAAMTSVGPQVGDKHSKSSLSIQVTLIHFDH